MKPSAQVIVDTARSHLLERHRRSLLRPFVAGAGSYVDQHIERCWMREFRLRAESTMPMVELLERARHQLVSQVQAQRTATPGEAFTMLNRGQHTASRFQSIAAFRLPDISERSQHARKTRTTVTVIARE